MVTSFTVTFSEPVNFVGAPPPPRSVAAAGHQHHPDAQRCGHAGLRSAGHPGDDVHDHLQRPDLRPRPAKSLIDGKYTLTLVANQIKSAGSGQFLDGNGNGTGGDNKSLNFHRLFGDSDGDRTWT